ncbi:MAG: L-rhamnose mutarotase [Bacteroidetes bacterium]|nr:L-rhamnose mutarotase [Bacteroidota bacterium]
MRKLAALLLTTALMTGLTAGCNSNAGEQTANREIKRVGMVIKIKAEHIDEYRKIHSASNAGVRDLLTRAHMHNFSIFLHQLDDGNWYEFGYYEYTGDDFEADMATLDKHPRNIEWLKVCDPMQVPLEGETGWAEMEQVYFNQ